MAAVCAVALHALMFAPLVFGTDARVKRAPDQQGLGSSSVVAAAEMVSELTFIALEPSASEALEALPDVASRGMAEPELTLLIASPDPNLAFEVEESSEEMQRQDAASEYASAGPDRALLFGRYMGQVGARIDRAWMRPRTPIGAKRFDCHAKIEQDRAGNVLSIELQSCNGDARWQQSLVSAIQRASPLSAPPEPSVFTPTLSLQFEASEYEPGVSIESEYEPLARLANAVQSVPETVIDAGKAIEDIQKHRGHVDLTIEGKKTTWELKDAAAEPMDEAPQNEAPQP